MKKIFSLTAVVLVAATVFSACKKNEDNITYPASLDGTYGAFFENGGGVSLWIEGNVAALNIYNQSLQVEKFVEGTWTYNSGSGKGTLSYNANPEISVQAQGGTEVKEITLIISSGDYTGEYKLPKLTDVGFKEGVWTGKNGTSTYVLNVSGRNKGYLTKKVEASSERFIMPLDTIYGFFQATETASLGMLVFKSIEEKEIEDFECIGYRSNDTIILFGSSLQVTLTKASAPEYPTDLDGVYGGYTKSLSVEVNTSLWVDGGEAQFTTFDIKSKKIDTTFSGDMIYDSYNGIGLIYNESGYLPCSVMAGQTSKAGRIFVVCDKVSYDLDSLTYVGFEENQSWKGVIDHLPGGSNHWSTFVVEKGVGTLTDTILKIPLAGLTGPKYDTTANTFSLKGHYGFYKRGISAKESVVTLVFANEDTPEFNIFGYRIETDPESNIPACDTLRLYDGKGNSTKLFSEKKPAFSLSLF